MDEFEDLDDVPTGKQCYVLMQEDRDEERFIRTTVVVMTEVFCRDEDLGKHIVLAKPGRSQVSRFFAELGARIVRVMEGGKRAL
jgi:hypothetical protein